MDGVHGRSRVTSGASRLHHLAGVTQVAPGDPANEWQGRRAQQPRTGLLASKWVLQFPWGTNLATVRTPVAMTGPAGFGIWGGGAVRRPERLANMEVISVLGRKPISQGREPQPTGRFGFGGWRNIWSYLPRIVPPLSWIPLLLHPEWGSKSVKKEWQEPHFFASYWRKGRGLHLRHS